MRVYEMTGNPAAREVIGYLLCRGGVHKEAYAKALEDLTGVEMTKLLPIRDTPNDELTEAKKYMDQGCHRTVYRFSPEDYTELGKICNGAQVDTGEEREVAGGPPERAPIPDLPELPRIRLGCCGGGRSRNRQQDRSELARTSTSGACADPTLKQLTTKFGLPFALDRGLRGRSLRLLPLRPLVRFKTYDGCVEIETVHEAHYLTVVGNDDARNSVVHHLVGGDHLALAELYLGDVCGHDLAHWFLD